MSDKAFVCERCGKLKPMAYAGIREPEFCKCNAPTDLARLMAENERLKKDAERYQWLRQKHDNIHVERWVKTDGFRGTWKVLRERGLDVVIDAALKGEPK